jgi:hypothetical protein
MTESATPICDLIEELLSRGDSPPGTIFEVARKLEASLAGPARDSGSIERRRERWRLKKARQRASKGGQKGGQSPGTKADPILTTTPIDVGVKKKKETRRPPVPGDIDDWPADHLEIFWKQFPPFRRQAKAKVGAKLAKIRASKIVTWATLMNGVLKFAATNPGEYAPAPMVWLNDGRWDREYGTGGSNARANGNGQPPRGGDAVFAAARRRAGAGSVQHPGRGEDLVAFAGGLESAGRAGQGRRQEGDGDFPGMAGPPRDV